MAWFYGLLAVLLGAVLLVFVMLSLRLFRGTPPRRCPGCNGVETERVYEQPPGGFDPRQPPQEPWGFARCRSCGAHIVLSYVRADEVVAEDRWHAALDHARRTAHIDP